MTDPPPTRDLQDGSLTVDDFAARNLVASNGVRWRMVSDRVMGGVSSGRIEATTGIADGDGSDAGARAALRCLHLSGDVRLDNNGGFVQAALDLGDDGTTLDATRFGGIRLRVAGNGEEYVAGLRTPDCMRPWQSYRATFVAASDWRDVELPFEVFVPHRLTQRLDVSRLRRLGLLAIGREFRADLYVAGVWLYRSRATATSRVFPAAP